MQVAVRLAEALQLIDLLCEQHVEEIYSTQTQRCAIENCSFFKAEKHTTPKHLKKCRLKLWTYVNDIFVYMPTFDDYDDDDDDNNGDKWSYI